MRVSGENILAYNNSNMVRRSKPSVPQVFNAPPENSKTNNQNPSFTAISTHGEFRYLTKNHVIHCPYCRKPMFYGGLLKEMLNSGVFSGYIKEFVTAIEPYRKYLKKGQHSAFQQIKTYAAKSPQTHLSEIITNLYHKNALKKLVRTQAQVFKDLIIESEKRPTETQASFRAFIKTQHKRLYEIPYIEHFNPETFAYKIKKMTQSIPNENLKTYLQNITLPLTEPVFKNRNAEIPPELSALITGNKNTKLNTSEDYIRYIITRVHSIAERLNRMDMERLCETSEKMLDGKPVIIPFSNKEFMQKLVLEELKDIRKSNLYYSMIEIAQQLPNSRSSMNSFVVKHRYSDSDTIGYKLIEPSQTTIEHIKALSEGGIDEISNWALACKADNNERQSIAQYIYLQKWNKNNPQFYFNDIINITNEEHLFNPSDIKGMAQSFLNEGRVVIDTSKIKK